MRYRHNHLCMAALRDQFSIRPFARALCEVECVTQYGKLFVFSSTILCAVLECKQMGVRTCTVEEERHAGRRGGVIYSYSMIKGEDGRQPRGNKQSFSCISFYEQSLFLQAITLFGVS